MNRQIAVLFAVIVLSGCYTYSAERYSVSVDNITALRTLNGKSVNVGAITATQPGLSAIQCRFGGPQITTPDDEPFSDFIRKALVDELKSADAFSPNAPHTLTGNLDQIDFSSNSGDRMILRTGNWMISLVVHSSNGKSMKVIENYSYSSSFSGSRACRRTAESLVPAVQALIGKLVQSADFIALIQ